MYTGEKKKAIFKKEKKHVWQQYVCAGLNEKTK